MTRQPRELGSGARRREYLRAAAALTVPALSGCLGAVRRPVGGSTTVESATELSSEITIAGSSTVYPISVAVARRFQERDEDVSISVASTGSGGGFQNFFCVGKTDLNDASRPIKDSEEQLCADEGIEFLEFEVATDALTVIVNSAADWVDCVTVEELEAIWRPNGATTWSDVRPDWPDEPFELYGAASTSGTLDYFTEAIMGEKDHHRNDYEGTEQDVVIVRSVNESTYSMGYLGFAYYIANEAQVKALAIDDGEGCVEPSLTTAKSGTYTPLSRPLFIYVSKASLERPVVREFCRFYIDHSPTDLVSDIGYVPISERKAAANRRKLDRAIEEVR